MEISLARTTEVTTLTPLVNEVYAEAEKGLWLAGATRTTVEEMGELIEAGEIFVARRSGELAGCVGVRRLATGEGEFGLLVADPKQRGTGVGRDLVQFAEDKCRRDGMTTMQLELLVPKDWTHPSKEFLAGWYTRIGYRVVTTGSFTESYPTLAPLLATPCNFAIYHKELA